MCLTYQVSSQSNVYLSVDWPSCWIDCSRKLLEMESMRMLMRIRDWHAQRPLPSDRSVMREHTVLHVDPRPIN